MKQIVCDCGWSVRGSDEELIAACQQHGREAHDLVPTPEQVLAVATPVVDQPEARDAGDTRPDGAV
jgi:predicted small metal-binding protein